MVQYFEEMGIGNMASSIARGAGFLGAPYGELTGNTKAAVLGLPFDMGTSGTRIGARHGPASIRQQSLTLSLSYAPFSVANPLEELNLVDLGDVVVTPGRTEPSFTAIEEAMTPIIEAGVTPLTFGGDGSVSLPQLRALAKRHGPLSLLHFDAHTDTSPPPGGSERHTSGTTFTRAAEEGLVETSSSFHIGARGPSSVPDIFEYGRAFGYQIIPDEEMRALGRDGLLQLIHETLHGKNVYLCWDMDFFDASAAPGVCDPTWGGPSAHEGLELLKGLKGLNLRACDINTVTPPLDPQGMTAHLAAVVGLLMLHLLLMR